MRRRNYLKADLTSRNYRNKMLLTAACLLLIIYFLASLIFGEMGVIKYYRMEARHDALMKDISSLKQDNTRLIGEVQALNSDPDRIELMARDKLGLARKGEIVYYYSDP
jgi:cell division protein FtsB